MKHNHKHIAIQAAAIIIMAAPLVLITQNMAARCAPCGKKTPVEQEATPKAEPKKATNKTMGVLEVSSDAELKKLLKENNSVVVKFYATWCSPCQALAPVFKKLASDSQYANVLFISANADNINVGAYKVSGLPTTIYFKDGKEVNRVSGNSIDSIRTMIASH